MTLTRPAQSVHTISALMNILEVIYLRIENHCTIVTFLIYLALLNLPFKVLHKHFNKVSDITQNCPFIIFLFNYFYSYSLYVLMLLFLPYILKHYLQNCWIVDFHGFLYEDAIVLKIYCSLALNTYACNEIGQKRQDLKLLYVSFMPDQIRRIQPPADASSILMV